MRLEARDRNVLSDTEVEDETKPIPEAHGVMGQQVV